MIFRALLLRRTTMQPTQTTFSRRIVRFWIVTLTTILGMATSGAQMIKFVPPADSIIVTDAGDIPPAIRYYVDTAAVGIDSLRLLCSGRWYTSSIVPSHRIPYCTFVVRDSLRHNEYSLWFLPDRPVYPPPILLNSSTFTAIPAITGSLSLVVSVAGRPVDSLRVRCIPKILGAVGDQQSELPDVAAVELFPNYPNPFNPSTTISYALSRPTNVTLSIFNILGQEVALLVNQWQEAGTHRVTWNGTVHSGVYFYRLQANDGSTGSPRGFVETKKMIFLK
jgi:hypothetical protein